MSVYAQDYGYFFDSNAGDRTYNSGSFEEWLRPFFTTGVFNGELEVIAQDDPDMTVTVTAGHANLDGKPGYWPSDNILNVSMASGVYNRIDTVVLRRDNINRRISLEMVTGVASSNPVPTPPTRTNDIFELVIAQIRVRTGTTIIENMDITDTRMDPDVCGWVAATVDQISFDQVKVQFDDWFEHVKGQLDEDAAGHLQNEIDEITENIGDLDGLETQEKNEIVGAVNELYENKVDKALPMYTATSFYSIASAQRAIQGSSGSYSFLFANISDNPLTKIATGYAEILWNNNYSANFRIILSQDGSVTEPLQGIIVMNNTNGDIVASKYYTINFEKAAITTTAGPNVSYIADNKAYYSGKIVTLAAVVQFNASGDYRTIFSIPATYRPEAYVFGVAVSDDGQTRLARVTHNTGNAQFQIYNPAVGKSYWCTITYIMV